MNELIAELELKAVEMADPCMWSTKIRLQETSQNMRMQNPCEVYSHLLRCIGFEQQILEQLQYPNENEHQVTQTTHQDIEQLKANVHTAEGLKSKWIRLNEELNQNERMEVDDSTIDGILNQELLWSEADDVSNNLMLLLKNNVALCQNLTSKVIEDYLKNWKWFQKYHGTNVVINGADLDCIQGWCESLTQSLWSTREQISALENYQQQFSGQGSLNIWPDLHNNVKNTLIKLINGSFIVEQQPPQVMKTNTKFSTTLRLLVGNVLNINISNPLVKTQIVSEVQAQRLSETTVISGPSCGKIVNGSSTLEYSEATRKITVNFTNLKLDGFRRPGKRAAENVTDEKFALFFETNLTIGDLSFSITAMSLPIVVIVHGSQESQAGATIFWDNSFSVMDRKAFQVPDQVTWQQFADALNQKYLTYNERGLSQENLLFLAEKLFKTTFSCGVTLRDDFSVSWNAFCKENLQDRTFSFWEWFYAALRVTKEHLHGPWVESSIEGFINKMKVEEYLKNINVHGTFLLRFSDSELGTKI
jgi:signal transducer and activator of transcription 5B